MTSNNNLIFDTSIEEFDKHVLQDSHATPILVDFWAQWCHPCIVIAPVIAQTVHAYRGTIKLAKLEVDQGENMKLAGRYQVRGFPSILLFRDGQEVARFSGAQPEQTIHAFIQQQTGILP